MFCNKCGTRLEDNAKFCPNCGAPTEEPSEQTEVSEEDFFAADDERLKRKKKRSGKSGGGSKAVAIIIVLTLLLAGAGGGCAYWFLTRDSGKTTTQSDKKDKDKNKKDDDEDEDKRDEDKNDEDENDGANAPDESEPEPAVAPQPPAFQISDIAGVYYSPSEYGRTLDLSDVDGKLSILIYGDGYVDVQTIIPSPGSTHFSIDYGGRIIEILYASSSGSVTVTENGSAEVFTVNGSDSWVAPPEPEIPSTPTYVDAMADPDAYILPSNTQYIYREDLVGMDKEAVVLARNELYARYGYSFKTQWIRDYFMSKNWYSPNPSVNGNTFSARNMNAYEVANLKVFQNYEKEMGW